MANQTAEDAVHFTITGRLPGYNELTQGHWSHRARIKAKAKAKVIWMAKANRVHKIANFVTVRIECYEPNKRRDPDNVNSGACKVILDALQDMGVLAGDGRKYIAELITPMPQVDRNNPRIEVEIVNREE